MHNKSANNSIVVGLLSQIEFRLEIHQLLNGSFVATLVGPPVVNTSLVSRDNGHLSNHRRRENNPLGAMYYVIAIILIYGLSIILMIASQIRKNRSDNGVARFVFISIKMYRHLCGT